MRKYPIKPWKKRNRLEKAISSIKYLRLIYDSIHWLILKARKQTGLSFSHWMSIGKREIRFQLGMSNAAIAKAAKKKKQ
jgi:hypothetical protein